MAGLDNYFEVERLLRQRKRGGKIEYLVQWKGFGEEEQTWEPEEHLQNCQVEILRLKTASPMATRRSKTPTRNRSRSRSRGRQQKSPSKSQTKKSPIRTRSRSRSRGRPKREDKAIEKMMMQAAVQTAKKVSSVESGSSRTVRRSMTVTSTTRSGVESTSSLAAGDASRYSLRDRKIKSSPVVVPKSLQPQPAARPKTLLERISCQDIFLLLVVVAIVGVAVAHHYKVIDVNQMAEVARQNLEKAKKMIVERMSSPPPPTAPPKTSAKP